jgi:hypothetical protein
MSLWRRSQEQEYDAAREELGGAPWREVPKSTDAWYILDEDAAALGAAPPRGRRGVIVGVAVAVGVALLATVALATRAPRPSAPLPVAVVAASPVAAPPVAAPPSGAAVHRLAHVKHHAAKHSRR